MTGPLERIMEYEDIRTTAGKLLQYVRSMPAVTSAIVGHKVGAGEAVQGGCGWQGVGVVQASGMLLCVQFSDLGTQGKQRFVAPP